MSILEILAGNTSGNTLYQYQNRSSPGSLSADDFFQLTYEGNGRSYTVAIMDVDNNGLSDAVGVTYSGYISVFKRNSQRVQREHRPQ